MSESVERYEFLTRYWFGKSMNAFVVNDLKVNKNTVTDWYMFCREVCMTLRVRCNIYFFSLKSSLSDSEKNQFEEYVKCIQTRRWHVP
ncbi:hypothetical protein TNCV_1389651 [Trichonephila clavipes]|nr:hypothetical protein TNCV_1389651 [Trichonephila clavipes]